MSGGFRSRSAGRRKPATVSKKTAKVAQKRTNQQAPKVDIGDPAREAAWSTLMRVDIDGAFANLVLPGILREHKVRGKDAAFATELTYGALRSLGVIDAVLQECSSRAIADLDAEVRAALRLGAYQLLYTRVGQHAAVDTSVRLVIGAGKQGAKGFVNAVLRTMSRQPSKHWIDACKPNEPLERIAFEHAHPAWIARSFATALGVEADDPELAEALEADSERPIVHLVARPGEISAEELALITGGDIGKYSPYAVYLPEGNPGELQPVRDGFAAVQDEGSQLIARALVQATVADDQGRWLDLCAGPGGKAAFIGSLAAIDGARVDAVEVAPHRAELVQKATKGLPVSVRTGDATTIELESGYDRVLVDAPCSGLGSLRRRPEARWTKHESDIASLTQLQLKLLNTAITATKPGGVIVYSTCSPDIRETRGIVDAVLATGKVEECDAQQLVAPMENVGPHRSVQMWPHRHGTDAMFFAVLRKKTLG